MKLEVIDVAKLDSHAKFPHLFIDKESLRGMKYPGARPFITVIE